jgi:hypothetical protein
MPAGRLVRPVAVEEHAELSDPHHSFRARLVLVISITISVASLIMLGWMVIARGPARNSESVHLNTAIEEKIANLDIKPRGVESRSEKALRLRNAIRHADYPAARKIIAAVLAESQLQNWRFYPLGGFMTSITDLNDPAYEEHLNEWVVRDKNDAIPLLVRAQFYYDMGWFRRGGGFVRDIPAGNLASFGGYMKNALADIDAAMGIGETNPYEFYLRLIIMRGSGT